MDRLNNILKQRLAAAQVAQSEHPSADTLAAFAEQRLKALQRETVLEHLGACADCRQAVLLATSEVDAEQAAPSLSRKPIFRFPAGMRWASLAAAVAVAVGVGLLFNEHQSAPRPAGPQETVRSVLNAPPAQPEQNSAKRESEPRNLETKQDALESSAANKPAPLNEKKKPGLITSRNRTDLYVADAANAALTPNASSGKNTEQLSVYAKLNQAQPNASVSNRDADQKVATNSVTAQPSATPPPPLLPASGAFSSQAFDTSISGKLAKAPFAPAVMNQKGEVLQGAVTDQSGAVVSGAEVSVTNVATGATRVVESGANGSYRVDPLPAGIYKIQVASPGFTTATAEHVETLAGAGTTQNFKLQVGLSSQTVEVSSEAPESVTNAEARVAPQAEQIPSKTSPAATVGGPLRRVQSVHGVIANWAISDTGQLQRTLSDGAITNVEPAHGMTVQSLAAQGIEVWAAGTQADPSAKEWTQRSVLFHSSDAGKTWSRVDGPWHSPITQLALSGKGNLVVTTQNGIWTTSDAGKTWAQINVKTKD